MSILERNLIEHPDQAIKLLQSEKAVMEMIAMGSSLPEILKTIALNCEENSDGGICSILLMDDDGIHLKHGAGPSLPDDFNDGINGEPIGPVAGSCGTAAFKKERVIVSDIAIDPLWINYRDFALQFGLKACCSTPILTSANKVLGTFAIYYKEVMVSDSQDLELIDRAVSQVKIALGRYNGEIHLKESEANYKKTINRITDGFVALDKKWRFTYMNKKAGEIFGLDPDQVLGERLAKLFPEGVDHPFQKAYEESLREQEQINVEAYYEPHDKWYENHIYPSPEGLTIYFKDITERKKINEIIQGSEEQYRTTIERITNGFVALDSNWCYTYMNKTAGHIFNRDPEQMIGKHIWTEFPEGVSQPFHEAYMNAMLEQKYTYLEEYYQPYDKWFENHIYPSPEGLSIYFNDITDRKRHEKELLITKESLERAEELSLLGSWEYDVASQKSIWSKQIFRHFNIAPNTNLATLAEIGKYIHPQDTEMVINSYKLALEGIQPKDVTFRANPINGLKYLHNTWKIDFDKNGKPSRIHGTTQDITKRQIEEDLLTKARKNLERAEEQAKIGNWELNISEKTRVWSDQMYRLFGFEPANEPPHSELFAEHIHPDDREDFKNKLEKLLTGDVAGVALIRTNPEIMDLKYLLPIAKVEKDKAGNPSKVYGTVQDVTKLHVANQFVKESEEKYRGLIEQATDAIFLANEKFRFVLVNSAACKLLGYSEAELLKLSIPAIIHIGEKDEALMLGERAHMLKDIHERKMIRKDGSLVPVEVNSKRLENGNYVAFIRDITERNEGETAIIESEEKYRALIEQASDAILITDLKGAVIEANAMAKKILGYTREEFTQLDLSDLTVLEKGDTPLRLKELNEGKSILQERNLRRKDGTLVPVEISATAVQDGTIISFIRDISDRKLAEQKILESRGQFQNLIENIPGVYWVINLDLKQTLYVSPSYETIWGRKCDDLYKNPDDFIQAVHPDDLELLAEANKDINKTRSTKIDYRIIKPDGEIRWIAERANVVIASDGQKLEYGYAEDVTNSRLADEKLRKERDKIAFISTTIPGLVGSFRIDPSGKSYFPYVSDAIMDIYGFSPAQAGKDANQIMGLVHPDDKKGMLQSIDMSTKNLSAWKHEYRYRHPIKGEIWLEGNFIPIRESNEGTIWHGVIIDISDRKEKERERQSLLLRNKQTIDTMLDGFILADGKGNIIEVNSAYCQMVGFDNKELASMNINQLEVQSSREEIEERIARMMEKKSLQFETTHQRKDKTIIDLDISISIMEIEKQYFVAAFVKDITERKKVREDLKKSHENLRELAVHLDKIREEERAALSRELHDELGQQLTAIKMDLSWLNKRVGSNDLLIDKIEGAIELTNEAVSTIRRINSDLRPTMLDHLGLFAALENQMKEFGSRFSGQSQLDIEMEDPQFDRAKDIAIFRVFQEALTNVGKHAKAKKIHASIRKGLNKMELMIVDDGIGFDRTTMSNLKSFGLMGMKERAMMINGSLEINSTPGQGTSVQFSVPM